MSVLIATVKKNLHSELAVAALLHGISTEADGEKVSLIGDVFKIQHLIAVFAVRHAGAVSDVECHKSVKITEEEATRNIGIKAARARRP